MATRLTINDIETLQSTAVDLDRREAFDVARYLIKGILIDTFDRVITRLEPPKRTGPKIPRVGLF